MTRFALAWGGFFRPHMIEILDIGLQACRGADIILFTPFSSGAYHLAELTGARCMRMALQPIYPTRQFPQMMTPNVSLGSAYNLWTYRLTDLTAHWSVFGVVNQWRKKHGLAPMRLMEVPYYHQNGQWIPTLNAYSAQLVPRCADWAAHVYITGFWELEQPTNWQAPPALLDFLETGEPPIYIGFGSMRDAEFRILAQITSQALAQTGQRGVLLGGWGGLGGESLGNHIFQINEAPHGWLFPHLKAAVHHGGIGTLAASLRAGLPTVVVPFLGDQPYWGRQVQKMRLGPAPILRKNLTRENLAQAIQQALQPEILQNARYMGEKLRQESGVQKAIEIITKMS